MISDTSSFSVGIPMLLSHSMSILHLVSSIFSPLRYCLYLPTILSTLSFASRTLRNFFRRALFISLLSSSLL